MILLFSIQRIKNIYKLSIITLFLFLSSISASIAQKNTLDYYISYAQENSPLLKDLSNQARSNLIDGLMIRAANKVQVIGSSNSYYSPVINKWGFDEIITNKANVTAIIGASKTLISQRNLQNQFEAIRLATEGLQNNKKLSEQDIHRAVTTQYIITVGSNEQLRFENEVYQLLLKEDTILNRLTKANVYNQTDYLTFLTTLQQQRLSLHQATIQNRSDFLTLLLLCGIQDTTSVTLEEPFFSVRQKVPQQQSIFFQQFAIDSLKNINALDLIKFNYKPKLNVFAEGGYNSSLALTPYKNFGTNFGLSLIVPIYDGNQRKMKEDKINIAEETRKDYKTFFTHQYDQQITQLSEQLKSTESLLKDIDTQIKYSEGLINAHFKLLASGQVRIVDLVLAINNYINAKNLRTQNRLSSWQLINQINYWNR